MAQEAIDLPVAKKRNHRIPLPPMRMPIRIKITLPYLILAVALAIGAAYIVTQVVFDTIDERFNNQLIESGKLASAAMVRQEDELLRSLRLFAYSQGLAEALQEGNADRVRKLAFGIAANQKAEMVEFLDTQGELVLSMQLPDGGGVEDYKFSTRETVNYKDLDIVQKVLKGKVDQLGDKYSGVVRLNAEETFFTSGPVYDQDGTLAGVVLVGKTLPSLAKQIKQELFFPQITLYSFEGQPRASTLVDPPLLDAAQVGTILVNQDTSSQRRNLDKQRRLSVSHMNYEEILGPWEGRGKEDLGVLGVSLYKAVLVQASRVTRIKITALVAVALFLVIVVGVNVANIITHPLISLMNASRRVAQGDLTVQVAPQSNDEVAVLTDSFNQMVTSLYDSKADLLKAYDSTLAGWSTALELRDRETEGHTQRVAEMTVTLARAMGVDEEALIQIRRGALLHDIGKMGIPDSILMKTGGLSEEDWVIMRKHPVYAYDMLWPIEYLRPALDIPYCHHEKWNGSGYPRGLSEEEIPLAARIFTIVDVWDAMRSDRPYRMALPEDEVCQYLWEGGGTHFDPQVVEAFFKILGRTCYT